MDAEKVLAATEEIRAAVLTRYRIGCANATATKAINKQMGIIEGNAPRRALEKLKTLLHWTDILFSARKHEKHRKGAMTGAEAVRGYVLADLNRIDGIAQGVGVDPRLPPEV